MVPHRRASKTTAVLNHLQRDAASIPKCQFAYIGPTYKQTKRIARDIVNEISRQYYWPCPKPASKSRSVKSDGSEVRGAVPGQCSENCSDYRIDGVSLSGGQLGKGIKSTSSGKVRKGSSTKPKTSPRCREKESESFPAQALKRSFAGTLEGNIEGTARAGGVQATSLCLIS